MKYRGFTLIELLVVIAIIGILSGTVFVYVRGTTDLARIAKGRNFQAQIFHTASLDLFAYWKFEEAGVPYLDGSGFGRNAAEQVSGPNYPLPTSLDEASCDLGLGKCLRVANSQGLRATVPQTKNDFTVSAFVRTTGSGVLETNSQGVVGEFRNSEGGWIVGVSNQGYVWAKVKSGSTVSTPQDGIKVNDGKWHHIAVSFDRDGNILRYADGQVTGTSVNMSGANGTLDPDTNFTPHIARQDATERYQFVGDMDDLAIFQQALTLGQIQGSYVDRASYMALAQTP